MNRTEPSNRIVLAIIAASVGGLILLTLLQPMGGPQPDRRPESFIPMPSLSSAEQVHFAEMERALAHASLDEQERLVLDERTGAALAAATDALPANLPAPGRERVEFLIRKSLPGVAGEQFVALFGQYARYRSDEMRAQAMRSSSDDLDAEAVRLATTTRLRREYFGDEAAGKLFGRESALAHYVLQLRRLEADMSLSEADKEAARQKLQAEYEQAMDPSGSDASA